MRLVTQPGTISQQAERGGRASLHWKEPLRLASVHPLLYRLLAKLHCRGGLPSPF